MGLPPQPRRSFAGTNAPTRPDSVPRAEVVSNGLMRRSVHQSGRIGAPAESTRQEGICIGVAGSCLSSAGSQRPPIGYLETWGRIDVWPDSVEVLGETLPHCGCPPVSLVWLSHGLRSRRVPREERLERGLFCSK